MHPNDFVMARIDAKQESAFASDLGLKPGQWPAILERANGVAFWKGQPTFSVDGELESVEYYRPGFRLTVFND